MLPYMEVIDEGTLKCCEKGLAVMVAEIDGVRKTC